MALPPHVFVIFGATGDLARRKLFPGLLRLWNAGLLPADLRVIGTGRHSPGTDDEFRDQVRDALGDTTGWDDLAPRLSFTPSDADDGTTGGAGGDGGAGGGDTDLARAVRAAEEELGGGDVRRIVYLSVPPAVMTPMVAMLGRTGLAQRSRLVLEKPFGTDLASARELGAGLREVYREEDVFRIDHFLGKEPVQNILALRFANGVFEPAWNNRHVRYVQIDVPEEDGIEGRASFMESTGAFRDMISTHLLQVLAFVAMERPRELTPDAVHAAKAELLRSVRPLDPARTVFGQYAGYRDTEGVDPDSDVETFVAAEVFVENPRWSGVPFLLRTGKGMGGTRRTVTVGFADPEPALFPDADGPPAELVLELTEQPDAALDVRAKDPGPGSALRRGRMVLDVPGGDAALEAYERLLLDVVHGDRTLFTTADEVERLWELCDPVPADPPPVREYPRGSWGPRDALDLPGPRGWRVPE